MRKMLDAISVVFMACVYYVLLYELWATDAMSLIDRTIGVAIWCLLGKAIEDRSREL